MIDFAAYGHVPRHGLEYFEIAGVETRPMCSFPMVTAVFPDGQDVCGNADCPPSPWGFWGMKYEGEGDFDYVWAGHRVSRWTGLYARPRTNENTLESANPTA